MQPIVDRVQRGSGLAIIIVALAFATGWVAEQTALSGWDGVRLDMSPLMAISYVLLGLALLAGRRVSHVGIMLLAGVVLGGLLAPLIARAMSHNPAPFWQWVLRSSDAWDTSAPSAISVVLGAGALFACGICALAPTVSATLIASLNIALWLGADALFEPTARIPTSLPDAVASWFLALGLLARGAAVKPSLSLVFAVSTLVFAPLLPTLLLFEVHIRTARVGTLLVCATAVLTGGVLAALTALAVARQIRQLTDAAIDLGSGLTPLPLHSGIREIDAATTALRDVAEMKICREEALKEKLNLEALGRLTGGVAHNFNNLLTIISGNIQLIEMAGTTEKTQLLLAEMSRAIDIGARLNQRLMSFACHRRLEPATTDLNALIRSMEDLLQGTLGHDIRLTIECTAESSTAHVDQSELENCLVNLALNSRSALTQGGHVFIRTDNASPNEASANAGIGRWVRISFSDTGTGMTADIAARAFEPFFTTKQPGQGTGLGLSTIDSFVKQSGGVIALKTAPEHGTTIELFFPATTAIESRKLISVGHPVTQGSGRTVLLVEDNRAVRRVIAAMLKSLGYSVVEAITADDAKIIVESGCHLDVIVSDVVMPGKLSGADLAALVKSTRPRIGIVLMSGFAEAGRDAASDMSQGILTKPFSVEDLAGALQSALQHDASQAA